ncbi:guanylate kinase [Paenibacillus sp. PL2-23]|uniref:guanylate kinase n=1 Tax=Paenibacillus sp. PL2-23 TaxID=2100729 RepID=UPI0030F6669B
MVPPSPYIFIFTGTSGSGRKTAAHRALKGSGIVHIPSCTDRPPRSREHPDSDYRYVSEMQFELMRRSDFFAETVRIDNYHYGIGRRYLDMAAQSNQHVYLILNREGSDAIRELYGNRVVRIFLYVDKATVQERLEAKGTSYEVIDSYLRHYNDEVTYRKLCEHVIVNVSIEHTITQIKAIIDGYLSSK